MFPSDQALLRRYPVRGSNATRTGTILREFRTAAYEIVPDEERARALALAPWIHAWNVAGEHLEPPDTAGAATSTAVGPVSQTTTQ